MFLIPQIHEYAYLRGILYFRKIISSYMSKYLKYMNTRIWKVFFILIKNIFILVDHVLNTSNT